MSAKAAKKKKASAKTSDEVEEKEVVTKEAPKAKKAKKAKAEVTEEQLTAEKATTEEPQADLAKKKKKKKKASEDTAEKPDDAQPLELAAKKKKKKKKASEDDEESTTTQAETTVDKEEETGGDFDFTKKKKKKKKKGEAVEDEDEESEAVPETPTKPQLKSALSQKSLSSITKKKVKIAGFTPEEDKKEETPEGEEEADLDDATKDDELDFSSKKKKKKKKKGTPEPVEEPEETQELPEDDENDDVTFAATPSTSHIKSTWTDSDRDYEFTELLATIYGLLNQNNPELMKLKNKFVIRPPDVLREGTKKTVWANFQEICDQMHRQSDHVLSYARAELGTSASVDGNFRLTIKGRFQPKQIESVVRHYINEYVTCRTCRSPDTLLKKENRLNFIQCKACGSTRSVAPIKQGFVAQVDKRKKV